VTGRVAPAVLDQGRAVAVLAEFGLGRTGPLSAGAAPAGLPGVFGGGCGCAPDGPMVVAAGPYAGLVHVPVDACAAVCRGTLAVRDEHLSARLVPGRPGGWAECADVLVGHHPVAGVAPAAALAARALRRHPGCLLVSVPLAGGGCVALRRGGRPLLVSGTGLGRPEQALLASFLHAWLVARVQPEPGSRSVPSLLIRSRSRWMSLGLEAVV
jgi:hypothetical protein